MVLYAGFMPAPPLPHGGFPPPLGRLPPAGPSVPARSPLMPDLILLTLGLGLFGLLAAYVAACDRV